MLFYAVSARVEIIKKLLAAPASPRARKGLCESVIGETA